MRSGKYVLGPEIGAGKFSKVYLASNQKNAKDRFAIKVVDVKRMTSQDRLMLEQEVKTLQQLDHSNVVRYFNAYCDADQYCIVMEYCPGGELFSRLLERTSYTEADARNVLQSLAQALEYCHARGVVHRDLKSESILFCTASDSSDIKLADFGFTNEISKPNGNGTQSHQRALLYIAPEVLKKDMYNASGDMWTFGVLAYMLLCGYPPFSANSDSELRTRIQSGNFSFDSEHWEKVSDKAKDMIRHLLKLDPSKRLTADSVLQHPWMTEEGLKADLTPALDRMRRTVIRRKSRDEIENMIVGNKLKMMTNGSSTSLTSTGSRTTMKAKNVKKPKPIHPLDLDLFRVALLSLVSAVGVTLVLFYASPRGKVGGGASSPYDVIFGSCILIYLTILHTTRCMTLGLHYLGEVLWGCNMALLLSGVGIATNRPLMVGTAVCVVAVDQLCWYIDVLGYIVFRKFLVGVAKYMLAPTTTWVHALTGTHHLWFIPVALLWLGPHGGIPQGSYWGSVFTTGAIATLARLLTPFAVRQGAESKDVRVWNINLAYEFYDDVAIPPLHIMDHRPAHIYLPFLILVCNFVLNVVPVAIVIALSRSFNGGQLFDTADWLPSLSN